MPGRADQRSAPRQPFPEPPPLPELDGAPEGVDRRVFLSGIGGTGIVTVNQVLATAAAGCGYAVTGLDQTGLSQKAGPVAGHLRYSAGQPETSNRLSARAADCILAFDLLTATTPDSLAYGDPDRTVVVASSGRTPTGAMVHDPAVQHPDTADLVERLGSVSRRVHVIDALGAADTLFGSVATANFLLVGAALQLGCLALPTAAVEEAITINGVAVEENLAAVRWGRVSVADPDAFARATRTPAVERGAKKRLTSLEASPMTGETLRLVELRAQQLVGYQGRGTAERYVRHVERVWRAERQVTPATELSEGVAVNLYKLTAYKDEYEVARLLTAPDCQPDGGPMLRDGRRMTFHLHPPVLRALGLRKKLRFGPGTHWVLRALARMRFLRGTPLDPFGMAGMRRVERRLLADYRSRVDRIIATLDASTYAVAVELASLPEMIRGYEGVKETSIETYRAELQRLEQAG